MSDSYCCETCGEMSSISCDCFFHDDIIKYKELEKEIASLKELVVQATPYVEYAVKYSTPLSQKLSEEWLEKTQARREK
ncbi:MAG: hypothetical protein KBC28_11330 [Alphaproteobacteria bacterium]|nr:hypothetical protein [Alphaproteobacteria bacterium]